MIEFLMHSKEKEIERKRANENNISYFDIEGKKKRWKLTTRIGLMLNESNIMGKINIICTVL